MGSKKILIVLTNHEELGTTGNKTGWYLPEVAHPYKVFTDAGYSVDFASPKGGKAPLDPGSVEAFKDDKICKDFLENKTVIKLTESTTKVERVDESAYKAIFFAGGHGPMFDLRTNEPMNKLVANMYENKKVVGAVCHGTVGLLDVKLRNGEYLVKGHKVTSFTDSEEEAVKLTKAMPFLLETELKNQGAKFESSADFQCHVAVSGRIVTGQNPASGGAAAQAILKAIDNPELNAL